MTMKKLLILSILLILTAAGFSQRISELPPASSLNPGDLLPIVQGGVTKKVTAGEIVQLISDSLSNVRILSDSCLEVNYQGALDTICFSSGDPGFWEADGDDIGNTNAGDITLNGQVYAPDIAATPGAKFHEIAAFGFDKSLFPKSIIDLYNAIQDSLAKNPSPYAIWAIDTLQGFVYLIDSNDMVGICTHEPEYTFDVNGSIHSNSYVHVGPTGEDPLFTIDAIGAIDGKTILDSYLDSNYFDGKLVADSSLIANENIYLASTTATKGQIKQNGETVFHTYNDGGGDNLFIGRGAGNFTNTGNYNIGIGTMALNNNNNRSNNTAVGYAAMWDDVGGGQSCAFGQEALSADSGNAVVGVGYRALYKNTASQSVGIGWQALLENKGNTATGVGAEVLAYNKGYNVNAIGYQTMRNNKGIFCYAFGDQALMYNEGNNNNGFGFQALENIKGGYNTGIGHQSMKGSATVANNTGQYNTAVGYQGLVSITSGESNTAIGSFAIFGITSGYQNTAVGSGALYTSTNGVMNTAIGCGALMGTSGGLFLSNNTAVGNGAGYMIGNSSNYNTFIGANSSSSDIIVGDSNTAIGFGSLNYLSSGVSNFCGGTTSLNSLSTGNNNTAIGTHSGYNNSTGNNNIFLGYKSGYKENGSNKLYIESSDADSSNALIFGNFATNKLSINGGLDVDQGITCNPSDTATAVLGMIVYMAADSSFYGCRSTTAAQKWYKLNP